MDGDRRAAVTLRLNSGQQELLRWLALLAMLVDHVGAIFLPADQAVPLRAIGRVAWPIFAFLLAYNVAVRGVDPRSYLGKLALFTLLSQLPHTLAFGWVAVSIMGTLLLGTMVLGVLERRISGSLPLLLTGLLVVIGAPYVEYGVQGLLLVVALWWALKEADAVSALIAVLAVAVVNLPSELWPFGLTALPMIVLVSRLPFGLPRSGLFPWMFYPLHLLLLAAVQRLT